MAGGCIGENCTSLNARLGRHGQGIALARTALAAWALINGRLVRPVEVSLRMSNTYWIVCPKVNGNLPKIAAFRKWLLAEAAEDARRLRDTLK
jgi:LysR family glycine cleavage system transcriptional activator